MSPDHDHSGLDTRLRRYGHTLDQAAEAAGSPLEVTVVRRPRRLVVGTAFAVTTALVLGGVAIVSGGSGGNRPLASAGRPEERAAGDFPRLLIDGWKVDRADESDGAMADRGPDGWLQVFSDNTKGYDGAMLSINTMPGNANWGSGEGARRVDLASGDAKASRQGDYWAQVVWQTGDEHVVVVTASRLSDDDLERVVRGLEPRDGGGWAVNWLPAGLRTSFDEATTAADVYHSAETTFVNGGDRVDLHLNAGGPAQLQSLIEDRLNSADAFRSGEVMGQAAAVTRYQGDSGWTAMWHDNGVVYELRSDGHDEDAFEDALGGLHEVDDEAWEDALPEKAISSGKRAEAVDRMLQGVPLPDGFDVDALKQGKATSDEYQLGAKVSGAVACAWFGRLEEARRSGDDAKADQALGALQTARDWQVLQDMVDEGDYPEVLWQYVDQAAAGAPLEDGTKEGVNYRSGLGCP